MIPDFRLSADGTDVSAAIKSGLVSLRLTDKTGMEADQLDISLVDPLGKVALPKRGVVLALALGWQGGRLTEKGTFKVDEVGEDGPPDIITIVARAADFTSSLKDSREASYHDTTLGAVLEQIAGRNGLTPAIHPELAATRVAHLDQTSESDANLVTRLGDDYGATATIKNGRLVFVPATGPSLTASGAELPTLTIARAEGDRHSFRATDRDGSQTGIQAKWTDPSDGKTYFALAGKEGSTRTLKRTYPSKAEAQAAAEAAWNTQKSQAHEFQMTLAKGRADILACSPLRLTGWRQEITCLSWRTGDVTHTLDGDGGFTTDLTATEVVAD